MSFSFLASFVTDKEVTTGRAARAHCWADLGGVNKRRDMQGYKPKTILL